MGCIHSEDNRSIRSDSVSVFNDIENTQKLREKFGYEYEYRIGPFFNKSGLRTRKPKTPKNTNGENSSYGPNSFGGGRSLETGSYKDGVFSQSEIEQQQAMNDWKQLARETKKKTKQSQESMDYSTGQPNFIVDKLDQMLLDINYKNGSEFRRKIKQGPPKPLRWSSWKASLQWNRVYETGLYEKLIEGIDDRSCEHDLDQILKDMMRTFPNQYYFSHEKVVGKSIGHAQLVRVLGAISQYFPDLGYCQGMNFILGFLIMVSGGSEIDVFWTFISLVRNSNFLIIGLYEEHMPLLKFLEFITEKKMKKHMGKFYDKFQELEVPNSFWMTKWYMTLFLYAFPTNICLRIWDFFMVEGIFGIVSIVLSILKVFEPQFQDIDSLDAMEFFQELTRNEKELMNKNGPFYLDMNKIIEEASKIKFKRKEICKLAKEYLKTTETDGENSYVKLFKYYDDKKTFEKKVQEFVSPKIFNHDSRSIKFEVDDHESFISNKNNKNEQQISFLGRIEEERSSFSVSVTQSQSQTQTQTQKSSQVESQDGEEKQKNRDQFNGSNSNLDNVKISEVQTCDQFDGQIINRKKNKELISQLEGSQNYDQSDYIDNVNVCLIEEQIKQEEEKALQEESQIEQNKEIEQESN